MEVFPVSFTRFTSSTKPIFTHVAAASQGTLPVTCRAYGFKESLDHGLIELYIRSNQWLRMQAQLGVQPVVSVLMTSGLDNESYQIKGGYVQRRELTEDDFILLDRHRERVLRYFPHMSALMAVSWLDCIAFSLRIESLYVQTPGPGAGELLMERADT